MEGVVVRFLNPTAVNVSWQRLPSQDVDYYKVYYSRTGGEGSELFPGGSSWGIVRGGEQFEVAAVVIVNGRLEEGERSTPPGGGGGTAPPGKDASLCSLHGSVWVADFSRPLICSLGLTWSN